MFSAASRSGTTIPVTFEGRSSFEHLQAAGTVSFIGAKFRKTANFTLAQFQSNALFRGSTYDQVFHPVIFTGDALFPASSFKAIGDFRGTHFESDVDFRRAGGMGIMLVQGVVFAKSVSLREADFLITLLREETAAVSWQFMGDIPVIEHTKEARLDGTIDLRGFTYTRLVADWRKLFDRLKPYDRQPYSHLEQVLRRAGQDDQADNVYLARRRLEASHYWQRVFQKNEYRELTLRQSIREIPTAVGQWIQGVLFNYGVRPYRLLAFSIVVLMIGFFVFSQPGAVLSKDRRLEASEQGNRMLSRPEAVNVSLNQFIPVLDIPPGSEWVPSNRPAPILGSLNISFAGYATIHRIAGAILVPLGIAALTGLLRRREN